MPDIHEEWEKYKREVLDRVGDFSVIFERLERQKPSTDGWVTALCPFHEDRNPSFAFNRNTGKWCCFAGCGKGSALDYLMQTSGKSFKETLVELGDRLGVPRPRRKRRKPSQSKGAQGHIEAVYDYQGETGELLFQVVRFRPKKFRQRRPDGKGGWSWNLKGVRRVPYRLPEIIKAGEILIVEGEKDADALRALGFAATCCPQGAGKWRPEYNGYFEGKHVSIIPDADGPGRKHAQDVAGNLKPVAELVKVVELPGLLDKGDVSDWINEGGTREALARLIQEAPEWEPSDELMPLSAISDTDLANAERLLQRHGRDLRHTPERGWFVWDKTRWAPHDALAMRRAKDTARAIYDEIKFAVDEKAVFNWAKRSQSAERLRAMLFLAQSEPGISSFYPNFDSDPWLLNVRNGTIDLRRGELLEHRREDLCSKLVDISCDQDAPCEAWRSFLNRVMDGNEELIGYMQRALGYTLTGDTGSQCLFFLYGTGANGKSVFLETVKSLLGEYGLSTPMETFTLQMRTGIPNDIARLAGARFVAVSETADGQRLNESLVKDLTGGDTVTARFLHREFFDFRPQFKLWVRGNHKPQIRGTDDGIWRRIHLIPFSVQIPEGERDPGLPDRLRAELPGILAWAVKGCLEWQRSGLRPPHEVRSAVNEYRTEMDVLGAFIAECCVVAPNCRATAKELYEAYQGWCKGSGEYAVSQTRFGTAMAERGFRKARTNRARLYMGIGLSAAEHPSQPVTAEQGMTGMTGHDGDHGVSRITRAQKVENLKSGSPPGTPVTERRNGRCAPCARSRGCMLLPAHVEACGGPFMEDEEV